jgi:uncharacterized protein YbbK (DUF523 family)
VTNAPPPVRIGISACLLGDEVRYDGGHKRDEFLADVLGPRVQFVKVCPEVEVGMGTPRAPLRLVSHNGTVRMVTDVTGVDHTEAMNAWAEKRAEELARENLSGYVLKSKSPSCGMSGVLVFGESGEPAMTGRGLFADVLLRRFPGLPVEEESRLRDPLVRDRFLARVFAYRHA